MSDPFQALAGVGEALRSADQPETAFAALDRALRAVAGYRLYTILLQDPANAESARIYTSHPKEYPIGGRKPFNSTPWGERVLTRGLPYLGRTPAEVAAVFYDHELIASLGCGSALNVPGVYRGTVYGTLNLLDAAGHYDDSHIALVAPFAAMIAPLLRDIAIGDVHLAHGAF